MGIGSTLQDLINANNTNPLEVSKATDVAATTIYSIIKRDSKSANITDLAKIAHHLGVTLDYFYESDSINISLTDHEANLIIAYREHPEMQSAVDRLLDVQEDTIKLKAVARSTDNQATAEIQLTNEQLDKMKNAPPFDEDI